MRTTPTLLVLTLPLTLACGSGDRDDAFDSGTFTSSGSAGETDGDPTGATGGDPTGATTADTTDGGTTGGGTTDGGTTGSDDPPATCDFVAGCYDDTMTWDPTHVGANSVSPAGCEGERFQPTAGFQVGGGGVVGGAEAHRAMPVLADYNGDGNLDVFLNPRKQTAYVVPGDGTGDFPFAENTIVVLPTPFAFSSGWGADAGDINGDGKIEPVVGDHGYDSAAWINQGNNNFTLALNGLRGPSCSDPMSGSCSKNHNGGGFGDWDGNGTLDLILGGDQFNGSNVNYKLNDGAGNWSDGTAPALYGSTGYIAAADMDNDGDLDVFGFTAGSTNGLSVQVFKNNGGSFSPAGSYANAGESVGTADPRQGGVGDVNCDGFVDIAAGGSIYLNEGGTTFNKAVDLDEAQISHLADMNGDGHLDLVTQDRFTGLAMYYNDGTGTNFVREDDGLPDETYVQLGTTALGTYGIDIGDLDGNGNLDIVRIAQFGEQWRFEAWTR